MGWFSIASHSGADYFLTTLVDFSVKAWVYLMCFNLKLIHYQILPCMVRTQFQIQVLHVISDNGLEFLSLQPYLISNDF